MSEWPRGIKQRYTPHVPVDYDCTSEASEEEWNDDKRDDDATCDSPDERWRQKNEAADAKRVVGEAHCINPEYKGNAHFKETNIETA